MNCKEAERMIPLFLEDELDTDELKAFKTHIENCEDCEEELSIQFLVTVGLDRLESGGDFDLQRELASRMDNANHRLQFGENMQWLLYVLEGLVGLALLILIVMFLIL